MSSSNIDVSLMLHKQPPRSSELFEDHIGKPEPHLVFLTKSWVHLGLVVPLEIEAVNVPNAQHCMPKIHVCEVAR